MAEAARDEPKWRAERRARLERLINGSQYVQAGDPALTNSLRWIALTTDQLLTRQRGHGIYAGLPWFPEYWGRDSFIALPGATLATGRFEAARAILASFAAFQDRDPASPFFRRLPNIVKPGSLDFRTTDGSRDSCSHCGTICATAATAACCANCIRSWWQASTARWHGLSTGTDCW